ncbi:hypothetical protein N1851_005185 [Merluccius polli]|uniref:Uncharacterized protein n=1 Tax=Merluccius polli TaxID=89951 RepID=A0AA47PAE9_MERPO|nr:hypothetical protein N1851_005185 [Merluccius polli]
MSSNLQRQKKLRGARAATTRLLDKIDREVGKEEPSTDLLEEYLEQLTARETALLDQNHDIEAETAADELENKVNSTFEYMDQIMSRKTRIKRILRNADENESAASMTSKHSNNEVRRQAVKWPKLVIEKFSGDVNENYDNAKKMLIRRFGRNAVKSDTSKKGLGCRSFAQAI